MSHRHAVRRAMLRIALAAAGVMWACVAAAGTPAPGKTTLTREEEAILCLDLKSLASLKADTATLQDMADRVERMQDTVAEVRTLIEAMPAAGTAASAEPPSPPPPPEPTPVHTAPAATAPQESLPLIEVGAGMIVGVLLTLLLRRRPAAAAAASAATMAATRIDMDVAPSAPVALPASPAPTRRPHRPPEALPPSAAPAAATATAAAPLVTPTLPEVDQALELADVMVSMGLTQGAAETLVDHIRANPRRALYHWLKLLDIYKGLGDKQEFERAAAELRRNFNIQADEWQADAAASARSLEDYGHLCLRVQELWGKPGCVDYLARLLEDNRGGARLGLPQAVAEEILLLIAVQRDVG